MQPHDAVVTLWFVSAENPAEVLSTSPKADRGFGRKYLALMDPTWPIAVIGEFPLNRSVAASRGEFYIAGYPGVTVVQTLVENMTVLSELSPKLLNSIQAPNIFAFAENTDTGFGGIAHWRGGKIRRSFCAKRDRVYEDIGLPEPFENPFWSGERDSGSRSGIDLPFKPIDLVREADIHWIGVDVSDQGPDLQVVGYAVDGRKEPRVQIRKPAKTVSDVVSSASTKLGINPATRDYDDYEDAPPTEPSSEYVNQAVTGSKRFARSVGRKLRSFGSVVKDKLKHTDRG